MYEPDEIVEKSGKITAVFTCASCKKRVEIPVTREGLEKRMQGEFIQDCFPEMDRSLAEMFISGICPECFDAMRDETEDDEVEEDEDGDESDPT